MAARKSSSPRPVSGGKGKPAPKPAGRERPASRKVSAASSRPTTQMPSSRIRANVVGRPPTTDIGTYSIAPTDVLATVGVMCTLR